jgi:RNA polymerase sigma factor (sigma-70 family)
MTHTGENAKPTKNMPTKNMPTKNMPTKNMPTKNMPPSPDALHQSRVVELDCYEAETLSLVNEERDRLLSDQPIFYIDNAAFHCPEADLEILHSAVEDHAVVERASPPAGLTPYLASLYSIPLLSKTQELYHFRKFNYLKYLAETLRAQIHEQYPEGELLDLQEQVQLLEQLHRLEDYLVQSQLTRDVLVRSNLRLVVSVVKRNKPDSLDFFEMVGEGNLTLLRAIDKFDISLGYRFSTYATWAISNNIRRLLSSEQSQSRRFHTCEDEWQGFADDGRRPTSEELSTDEQHKSLLMSIIGQLPDQERAVIIHRFGLIEKASPMTQKQVSDLYGITKHRVRQTEMSALQKIRKIVCEDHLPIHGF